METFWKTIIWSQFGAAIDMLENAIRACPDELWSDPSKPPQWISNSVPGFWYVAYHTIFFLDYDLSESEKEFVPPAPFTLDELDPPRLLPERPYTKDELLALSRTWPRKMPQIHRFAHRRCGSRALLV